MAHRFVISMCTGQSQSPQFLSLAVIGAILFALSLARFRKTLGTMA
jgi:hypothetical protein